jgi:hypothetical protein
MNVTRLNNNNYNNNLPCVFRISKYILPFSIFSFLFLVLVNSSNIIAFGQQPNSEFQDQIINIVAVGDFYCNDETEDTIENIILVNPELIITTGDHVKDDKSADCWIEMSEPLKDRMKIAIGNHDRDSSKIYKQITRNHNLTSPYYSHDFKIFTS